MTAPATLVTRLRVLHQKERLLSGKTPGALKTPMVVTATLQGLDTLLFIGLGASQFHQIRSINDLLRPPVSRILKMIYTAPSVAVGTREVVWEINKAAGSMQTHVEEELLAWLEVYDRYLSFLPTVNAKLNAWKARKLIPTAPDDIFTQDLIALWQVIQGTAPDRLARFVHHKLRDSESARSVQEARATGFRTPLPAIRRISPLPAAYSNNQATSYHFAGMERLLNFL